MLITDAYRAFFIDVEHFVSLIHDWAPATRILEVGCGEGELTRRLASAYVDASIVGIDITPRIGRLCENYSGRVEFRRVTVQEFADTSAESFDLVIVADVLHHVPWPEHRAFLHATERTLSPRGRFVLKDWERRPTPVHLVSYLCDRFLTGDKVRYATADELRDIASNSLSTLSLEEEHRLRPWRNNLAFFMRRE